MTRRATVIRVDDAATFIIRPNMVVKLRGVDPPTRGTPEDQAGRERLAELVMGKKVEFDTLEWDRLGRSVALATVEGLDLNEEMKGFVSSLKKGVRPSRS